MFLSSMLHVVVVHAYGLGDLAKYERRFLLAGQIAPS